MTTTKKTNSLELKNRSTTFKKETKSRKRFTSSSRTGTTSSIKKRKSISNSNRFKMAKSSRKNSNKSLSKNSSKFRENKFNLINQVGIEETTEKPVPVNTIKFTKNILGAEKITKNSFSTPLTKRKTAKNIVSKIY